MVVGADELARIDIGTSSVKLAIVGEDGRAQYEASSRFSGPGPAGANNTPMTGWAATDIAVQTLAPAAHAGVRGIGFAGQMHSACPLDRNDTILSCGFR